MVGLLGGTKRFVRALGARLRAWLYRRWLFRLALRLWTKAKVPLYRNALFLMMNTAMGSALGFFFWVIMTRVYTKEDIGFAVALFSTVSFAGTLGLLGISVSLIRYLPEADDKENLLNVSLTIVGIASLIMGAAYLLVIAAFGLDLSFVLDSPVYLLGIVLGAFAVGAGTILDNAAVALRRADVSMWRTIVLGVAKIPVALAIALTLTAPFGVGRLGVFLALVVGTGISVLVEGVWLLPRILPRFRPRPRFDFKRLGPMFRFSAGNYIAMSTGAAGGLLLTPLILAVSGPSAVTYFYVGSAVASLLGVIPSATFSSFYAEASRKEANGTERHRDERRAILLSTTLLVPAIVVMWIFAHFLLLIFYGNEDYASNAEGVLRILVFASVPGLFSNVLVTRVRVRRRSLPLIVGTAIGTIVNLGIGYAFLQSNGITGLAVATVLGSVAPLPYYWFVARRSFESEPLEPTEPATLQP